MSRDGTDGGGKHGSRQAVPTYRNDQVSHGNYQTYLFYTNGTTTWKGGNVVAAPFSRRPRPIPPSRNAGSTPRSHTGTPAIPGAMPTNRPGMTSSNTAAAPVAPTATSRQPTNTPFSHMCTIDPRRLFRIVRSRLAANTAFALSGRGARAKTFSFRSCSKIGYALAMIPRNTTKTTVHLRTAKGRDTGHISRFLTTLSGHVNITPTPTARNTNTTANFTNTTTPTILTPGTRKIGGASGLTIFTVV